MLLAPLGNLVSDWHYEHAITDGQSAGVATIGAVARTPAAGIVGQPVSDGCYEHTSRSGHAGALGIVSRPFVMARALESGWLELPSTLGWLGSTNTSGRPELPDVLVGVVMLAPSSTTCLTGVTSRRKCWTSHGWHRRWCIMESPGQSAHRPCFGGCRV